MGFWKVEWWEVGLYHDSSVLPYRETEQGEKMDILG
jgi:hypothetical protein